jgi:FtsK/SpoIIIE family
MNQAYGNTRLARGLLWVCAFLDVGSLFPIFCTASSAGSGTGIGVWMVLLLVANIGVGVYATAQGVIFELLMERAFKRVCGGLGFTGTADRWKVGLGTPTRVRGGKTTYPLLREVRGTSESWVGLIRPFAGQTVADYIAEAEAFALAYDVPFVTFEAAGSGRIRMRCGPVQVPEAYEYEHPLVAAPDQFDVRATLQAVAMARDINNQPWYMPIEGNHLLLIGRTGAGKSSWIYSLVFGLAAARQAGLVKLLALDAKRLELAYGMQLWDEYADTDEGMVELLEKAVTDMLERNKALQGKARKFTPSVETPLNVIIIDELAYLSAATDKKLQQRAQMAMRTILWLGRATGYSLVGASQTPLKEVLAERDYYPTKVALGMEASLVDLVLGKGAHDEAHAYAEQIPLREAGAGCAYVMEEQSSKALLVRAAWCSDDMIRAMLGIAPGAIDEGAEFADVPQLGFDSQVLE